MSKPWRELEQLVRDLERIFAGQDVVIRSPDRMPDRTTGRPREVDVSLRRRLGSAEILVVLECRKRGQPEDVTWIEQLATKAADIGASKMIAVSSKRFTSGAVAKAAAKNIELRTFNEITEGAALRWMGGVAHHYDLLSVGVAIKASPDLGLFGGGAVPHEASRVDEMVLVLLADGAEMSLFQLLPLKDVFSAAAATLPFGERQTFASRFAPPPGQLGVKTGVGVAEVTAIDITVAVERRLPTASSTSYEYVDQHRVVLASGTEVSLDTFGIPIKVNYARHGTDGEAGFVVRREDNDRDRMLMFDFALVSDDGARAVASGVAQPAERATKRTSRRGRSAKPTE